MAAGVSRDLGPASKGGFTISTSSARPRGRRGSSNRPARPRPPCQDLFRGQLTVAGPSTALRRKPTSRSARTGRSGPGSAGRRAGLGLAARAPRRDGPHRPVTVARVFRRCERGSDEFGQWAFWIDQGGTFTDVIGRRPDGSLAALQGPLREPGRVPRRRHSGRPSADGDPSGRSDSPRRRVGRQDGDDGRDERVARTQGDRTVLVVTKGFRDALRIGYQARADIFAKKIGKPDQLYESVLEVDERCARTGPSRRRPISKPFAAALKPRTRRE